MSTSLKSIIVWASSRENLSLGVWEQQRCRPACASAHTDQRLCYIALNRVTSDIKEGMVEQGVTDVRRITVRRDRILKLTNTYVLSFNTPNLPTVVKIGFMQVKVDVYIPDPL